jgi:hypothetical protein
VLLVCVLTVIDFLQSIKVDGTMVLIKTVFYRKKVVISSAP